MARNRPNVGAVGSVGSRTACGGLFRRKEVWTLSLRGWLAVFLVTATIASGYVFRQRTIFGDYGRVDAPVLVMEGWLPDTPCSTVGRSFRRDMAGCCSSPGGRGRNGLEWISMTLTPDGARSGSRKWWANTRRLWPFRPLKCSATARTPAQSLCEIGCNPTMKTSRRSIS